jgi:hypothetical protein
MERALALKAHDQAARLWHFIRVIFNHIVRLQCFTDLVRGNFTFEHTLNSVDAVKDFDHAFIILCAKSGYLPRRHKDTKEKIHSFVIAQALPARAIVWSGIQTCRFTYQYHMVEYFESGFGEQEGVLLG